MQERRHDGTEVYTNQASEEEIATAPREPSQQICRRISARGFGNCWGKAVYRRSTGLASAPASQIESLKETLRSFLQAPVPTAVLFDGVQQAGGIWSSYPIAVRQNHLYFAQRFLESILVDPVVLAIIVGGTCPIENRFNRRPGHLRHRSMRLLVSITANTSGPTRPKIFIITAMRSVC